MKKKTQQRSKAKKTPLEAIYLVWGLPESMEGTEDLLLTDNRGSYFLAKAREKMHWVDDPIGLPKKAFRKITLMEALEWAIKVCKFSDGGHGDFRELLEEFLRRLKAEKS